ncbi:MAG: phosphodiester glycosidase family protein [Erysipelotrichaceae bacterium]|nr:phosphodiester glycosidase family protein [Erysipelotrichaceae bacterium]
MKKKMFYIRDCLIILIMTAAVLLDTFVVSQKYTVAAERDSSHETAAPVSAPVITGTSYQDENISVSISTYRYNDTDIYVADVQISDLSCLYSVLADNTYGKNVTEKTSEMALENSAVLAVNGDYYGARNSGYVIRDGVLYRDKASGDDQEDLVIWPDGSFEIITEGTVSAQSLADAGALQVYSFGPALIENGEISVGLNDEVGRAKASNPRTAVCEIEPLHYLFVVSDGRTDESEGLSLYELAEFLETFNVKTAYNLDGGGSSTMVFMGELVNNPTTGGNRVSERSVSDALCIGY